MHLSTHIIFKMAHITLYMAITFALLISGKLSMKCEIGYKCQCSETYELINCNDLGIRNMSTLKFTELHYKNVKHLNLQRNQLTMFDWSMLEMFDNITVVNVQEQEDSFCFNERNFNDSRISILNDCDIGMDILEPTTPPTEKPGITTTFWTKLFQTRKPSTIKPRTKIGITVTTLKHTLKPVKRFTVTSPTIFRKTTVSSQPTHTIKKTTPFSFSTKKKIPVPARQQTRIVSTTIESTDMTEDYQTTPENVVAKVNTSERDIVIAYITSCVILVTAISVLSCYILLMLCQCKCFKCCQQICVCKKKHSTRNRHRYINEDTQIDNISFESVELFASNPRVRKDSKDS